MGSVESEDEPNHPQGSPKCCHNPIWAIWFVLCVSITIALLGIYGELIGDKNAFYKTPMWGVIGTCSALAVAWGYCLIFLVNCTGAHMLRLMLCFNTGALALSSYIVLSEGFLTPTVLIGNMFFFASTIYAVSWWCHLDFDTMELTSKLTDISRAYCKMYWGIHFVALGTVIFNVFWVSGSCLALYFAMDYTIHSGQWYLAIAYFLFGSTMIFWGASTVMMVCNIAVTAGFTAWFQGKTCNTIVNYVWACTRALGAASSVSLTTNIIDRLHQIHESLHRHKWEEWICYCRCCNCIFKCFDYWMPWYNKWAVAEISLKPDISIYEGAKQGYKMVNDSGVIDISQDSLVPMLLNKAAFVGAANTTAVACMMAQNVWGYSWFMLLLAGVCSFIFAHCIIAGMVQPYHACDAAIAVLLAEEPEQFKRIHRNLHDRVLKAIESRWRPGVDMNPKLMETIASW